MKKIVRLVFLALTLCVCFTSCSGIYADLPSIETPPTIEVDLNAEYFTTGSVYNKGNLAAGGFYDGYWIYREIQEYEYKYKRPDGKIMTLKSYMDRLVKVNAATGVVSSLCLDPVCNHSVGSGCLMICPELGDPVIQGFVGDNIIFTYGIYDKVYGTINQSYVYNLKTGEAKNIFAQNMEADLLTKYSSRYIFGDTYYVVKDILDYSETDYDPASGDPLSDYEPKTVSILCEYDFKKDRVKELFEIPAGYSLSIVSSKRFFFTAPEDGIYSCDRNGENMKKEDVLDFSPYVVCGTYAYKVEEKTQDMKIYDLRTNTMTEFPNEVKSLEWCITDFGIIKNDLSVRDELLKLDGSYKELKKENPDLTPAEHLRMCNKLRCNGTTQIWRWSLDGSNPQKIFELEKGYVAILQGTKDYLYGYLRQPDPNNDYEEAPYENSGRVYINLKTGEITPVPYLELIVPELVE
ncbi:MAG: hypothetical protein ACI3XI_00450 [Eubacteriales bacterium]